MEQKQKKVKERNQRKKKQIYNRLINDRIIRDIRTFFKQEEKDYYKTKSVISGIIIIFNVKVMVIKIETFQQMNILMKLNYI